MSAVHAPPATCVHVACAGQACRYAAPAIGPELPLRIAASDGVVWTRFGSLYYGPNNGDDGRVTTWDGIARADDASRRFRGDSFPAGAWEVAA